VNRRAGVLSWLFIGMIFIFLYAPMAVLVTLSFNSARRGARWEGLTLDWYTRLFHDPAIVESFTTSLQVAVLAALLSALLGLCVGYTAQRGPVRSRKPMGLGFIFPSFCPRSSLASVS
jgi:spermidine/putrescine transport system permease protein